MITYTKELTPVFREIADKAAAQFPSKGRTVIVSPNAKPKKSIGKKGVVFWHGPDQYCTGTRYLDDIGRLRIQLEGRWGYRVGIQTETGEKFFVSADFVEVISE